MSTVAIVIIIIAVIVVAAIVVLGPAMLRQARIRRQFGPEYNRLAKEVGSRKAVAELTARQQRVQALGIHPLSAEQQARYSGEWTAVQQRFVEDPAGAVSAADTLVWDVMQDRGYPPDDRKASLEALSVYHARTLGGYRQAQEVRPESASTEELRTAMLRYRALFRDLVGAPAGQGTLPPGAVAKTKPAAGSDVRTRKVGVTSPKTAGTPR
jgi:Ion transport protein N-terminal